MTLAHVFIYALAAFALLAIAWSFFLENDHRNGR